MQCKAKGLLLERCLGESGNNVSEELLKRAAPTIWRRFCQLWRLGVLHGDVAARNVMILDPAAPPAAAPAGPEADQAGKDAAAAAACGPDSKTGLVVTLVDVGRARLSGEVRDDLEQVWTAEVAAVRDLCGSEDPPADVDIDTALKRGVRPV